VISLGESSASSHRMASEAQSVSGKRGREVAISEKYRTAPVTGRRPAPQCVRAKKADAPAYGLQNDDRQ
jgi:hypothetical protein